MTDIVTDQLRVAVDLLQEALKLSPYGLKDIPGSGYRIHRDGSFTGFCIDDDDDGEDEWDCGWEEVEGGVEFYQVADAINELLADDAIDPDDVERLKSMLAELKGP